MKNPSGVGRVVSPVCGDMMEMYIKVARGSIVAVKFKTFGCWVALAAGSIMSEMAIGMKVKTAANISIRDLLEILKPFPKDKLHCVQLSISALRSAIDDYAKRKAAQLLSPRKKKFIP